MRQQKGLRLSIIEMCLPPLLRFPYPRLSLPEARPGFTLRLEMRKPFPWNAGTLLQKLHALRFGDCVSEVASWPLSNAAAGQGGASQSPEPDQSKQLGKCHKESQSGTVHTFSA